MPDEKKLETPKKKPGQEAAGENADRRGKFVDDDTSHWSFGESTAKRDGDDEKEEEE